MSGIDRGSFKKYLPWHYKLRLKVVGAWHFLTDRQHH